ncbi:MAG: tRNA (guanosine(46)-N7)-methyltransferase TrmB [Alphaproteobacteria bacterium]|nr:tRNA (guanosine(46)-N7)-methyltransferase TrmB [Alphaproteobacteria bacterium]
MTTQRLIHSFGRRRGRKLRAGRAALLDTLLPQLGIALPAGEPPVDPRTLFAIAPREVWLEIGFGGGEHLAWQAGRNPDVGLIGCEPYENGVVALLGHVRDRGLANIRIWNDDARPLLGRLAPASIARAFVLFPDPWPKARHHKRRLIQAPFLDALARVLQPGAEFRLASDHADYVEWMLERVPVHPDLTLAARFEARPDDWPETRYEAWSVGEGRRPTYFSFVRR